MRGNEGDRLQVQVAGRDVLRISRADEDQWDLTRDTQFPGCPWPTQTTSSLPSASVR